MSSRAEERPDAVDRMQADWARERPGTDVRSIGVVTRLYRVTKLLQDDHRRLVGELGIDAATRDLLSALRRSGPPYRLSSGELARRSLITSGAASQRLARAEAQGLVRRVRGEGDGRSVLVELTPDGHALIEDTVERLFAREQELLGGLSAAEQVALAGLLRTLLASLGEELGVPDWA